jgi:hypothetical protein
VGVVGSRNGPTNGPTIISQPSGVKYPFEQFKINHSFFNRNLNSQFSSFQREQRRRCKGRVKRRRGMPKAVTILPRFRLRK